MFLEISSMYFHVALVDIVLNRHTGADAGQTFPASIHEA